MMSSFLPPTSDSSGLTLSSSSQSGITQSALPSIPLKRSSVQVSALPALPGTAQEDAISTGSSDTYLTGASLTGKQSAVGARQAKRSRPRPPPIQGMANSSSQASNPTDQPQFFPLNVASNVPSSSSYSIVSHVPSVAQNQGPVNPVNIYSRTNVDVNQSIDAHMTDSVEFNLLQQNVQQHAVQNNMLQQNLLQQNLVVQEDPNIREQAMHAALEAQQRAHEYARSVQQQAMSEIQSATALLAEREILQRAART